MPYQGKRITSYFGVDSIGEYIDKAEKLGDTIIQPKTTVPGRDYFALCLDTEKNLFGLWQYDENAQ
jgi:predicted enzyme related to lactoylglutathione lyase